MITLPITPQPFQEAATPERLAEGRWRFYRRNTQTGKQEYMDIPEPEQFQDPEFRLNPNKDGEIWYWTVVDVTKIKVQRGI